MYKLIFISIIGFISVLLSSCKESNEELSQTLRSKNDIYYNQNNQDATRRVESIMYNNTNINNIYERFKIVHISDTHLSDFSLNNHFLNPINLIQSIRFANQPKLKINAITITGDFISNDKKDNALSYLQSFYTHLKNGNNIPSIICTGNHDCNLSNNNSENYISSKEIHSILFPTLTSTNTNYYYIDLPNPQGGTFRFISLDMLDQPKAIYNTLYYAYFSPEQINWLGEVALKKDMTNQHSVIIMTHYPLQPYSSDAYTYLCDGDFIHPWSMIPEIVEAFRSHTKIHKTFQNKVTKEYDLSINFDFSNSQGEFVCYLGGHAHVTTHFNIEGFDNQNKNLLPQKTLLCTNQAPSEIGKVYNKVFRKEDSLSSNSFCIYAIDTYEKKIHITYFGAYKPSDNSNYPEIEILSY